MEKKLWNGGSPKGKWKKNRNCDSEYEKEYEAMKYSEDVISREQFREQMYHRCFEVDNDEKMQKWDSGCWIRYKLFEEELDKSPSVAPSVIPTQNNAIQHVESVEKPKESVEKPKEDDYISREWVLEKIDACYGETVYACNLAVALERAIKSAPSVIPQVPSEDCISRKKVLSTLNLNRLEQDIISRLPSVAPKPKEGKWMPIIEANEFGEVYQVGIYCSECGETLGYEANFCPNCGADMRMKGASDETD